jgi:hypothetical protein
MTTLWNINFFVYAATFLFIVPGHELKNGGGGLRLMAHITCTDYGQIPTS